MGQRGPAPEPARLRILKGETRPSQLGSAPQPQNPPRKPRDLSPESAAIWDDVLAATVDTAHIGQAHALTFRAYCEVSARLFQHIDPMSREWRDLADKHRQLARELCLTPATSTNLHRAVKKDDRAARFLTG